MLESWGAQTWALQTLGLQTLGLSEAGGGFGFGGYKMVWGKRGNIGAGLRLLQTLGLSEAGGATGLRYAKKKKPPCKFLCRRLFFSSSGHQDSNLGPPAPKAGALPGCATPRRGCVDGCVCRGGEGGIRTRGTLCKVRRFSKPVVSATHPLHQALNKGLSSFGF